MGGDRVYRPKVNLIGSPSGVTHKIIPKTGSPDIPYQSLRPHIPSPVLSVTGALTQASECSVVASITYTHTVCQRERKNLDTISAGQKKRYCISQINEITQTNRAAAAIFNNRHVYPPTCPLRSSALLVLVRAGSPHAAMASSGSIAGSSFASHSTSTP